MGVDAVEFDQNGIYADKDRYRRNHHDGQIDRADPFIELRLQPCQRISRQTAAEDLDSDDTGRNKNRIFKGVEQIALACVFQDFQIISQIDIIRPRQTGSKIGRLLQRHLNQHI